MSKTTVLLIVFFLAIGWFHMWADETYGAGRESPLPADCPERE